jgi:hypothetical protein
MNQEDITRPMNDHAVEQQAAVEKAPPAGSVDTRRPILASALVALGSLKLTIVLFLLAMVLLFAGTIAQTEQGIFHVLQGYFRTVVAWIDLRMFLPGRMDVDIAIPWPGGWLIGGAMVINLLAMMVVYGRLTWRWAGMFLIHGGLIALLIGELLTGVLAVEGRVSLMEGQSVHYIERARELELAIVDRSAADYDEHVVVAQDRLQPGMRIGAGNGPMAEVPVDLVIERFQDDVLIVPIRAVQQPMQNPADRGVGRQLIAIDRNAVAGVPAGGEVVEIPAAYVSVYRRADGEPLGTYLLSPALLEHDLRQTFAVDGTEYELQLRHRRDYQAYEMHLVDFTFDRYPGTDIPRQFRSTIRLNDPTRDEQREVAIYMNHPLRYDGRAFYQYQALTGAGNEGTVLQVVANPTWWLPYVASALVTAGLLWQFAMRLAGGGLRKRRWA